MGVGKQSGFAGHLARAAMLPLLLGASSANAQGREQEPNGSTAIAVNAPTLPPPFVAEFEPFIGPRPDLGLPPSAVDLDTIEPPLENPIIRSLGTGVASYYGRRFHGRLTANGERFNMNAMTAAHKTLPFGTKVRVTNPRNGKSVVVRINDRGPFIRGRTIDLSRAAASRIGMISSGHARVELDVVR